MPYISLNKANSNHKTRDANGQATSRYSRYETGIIEGGNRQLMAVIADSAGFDGMGFNAAIGSSDDHWHVANVFDSNRRYIDTMVIAGAFDSMHAKQVADSQLHHLGGDNCVVMANPQFDSLSAGKPDTWSIDAIDKLLNNRSQDRGFLPVITAQELNAEAARVTFDSVQWDSMSGLVSHNGNDSALFLDMVRADGHKQLLEPLNLVRELAALGAEEFTFDALMDKKLRLTLLTDRLFNAMSRAGDADLSVTGVTETKPFKRQGVTNIAYIFDLSDGQKLSIWFHNPDSTPSQLKPDDIMISWKWMLNKRDVTAVLSPKQGDNVQLPALANRIMRVARKNSKRYQAALARAAVVAQELADAQALVEAKKGEIDQLDTDISGLNADIDAAMAAQKEIPKDVPPPQAIVTEPVQADDSNDSDEPIYTPADVVDEKVYKTMGAAKANMTKNQLDKRRFEIVEIAGGGFGIKANPLDREVLRPQIFALIDQGVAAYPDPENVTMIINRSGFDVLGKIADLTDARIEELERENIITRDEIKAAVYAHIQEAPAVVEVPAAPVVEPVVEPVATDEEPIAEPDADVIPEKLNQVEALFELSKLAPKAGEAIKSDDPDAIEKLEAKLAYHQARAAMMRDANKNLRRGDDDALYAMGFKDKTIAALKEPDYAGRTGFVDYQMTNNNGEIGRIKKRLKVLYKERDANAPAPVTADNISTYIADAATELGYITVTDNGDNQYSTTIKSLNLDSELSGDLAESKRFVFNYLENIGMDFSGLILSNGADVLDVIVNAGDESEATTDDNSENAEPIVITGQEIEVGEDVDFKTAKNNAMAYFDNNLKDKVVFCPAIDSDVLLRRRGGKHIAKSNNTFREKLKLVTAIPEMIKRGKYGHYTALNKEKGSNIAGYYVLNVEVMIDDSLKAARVVLEKNNEGEVLYDIGINKKEALAALGDTDTKNTFDGFTVSSQYQDFLGESYQAFDNEVNQFDKLATDNVMVLNIFFDDAPASDDANTQTMQAITEFAKTHEGFNGFIGDNSEAEAAVAGKPAGDWVVKIDDDQTMTVFMSLGNGQYTGAYNLNIELAYNDIFKKTAAAADRFGTVDELANVAAKRTTNEAPDEPDTSEAGGASAASKRVLKGKTNKAKTAKGTSIASEFALVDAKFLIASHSATGTKNPDYPQDLQPRDRARESSIAWVQKTSKSLDPESLGRTSRVDTGAPIVGDDLIVESGNGRTIAIKMAYKNGDAKEYREWLIENARMFGFTEQQVESYKQPVLVRMRTTDVNRAEFAVEANQDDKLSFTASERAKADSKRISGGMLELFTPSANGEIDSPANRPFVKQFLASLGATEAAQYTDSNGYPTQALIARIKGALFSKAYDDDRLLEMMADQTKPDLQNMLNALTMAAPSFVAAQAVNPSDAQDLAGQVIDGVEKSINDEVKNAIVDATNMIMNANKNNQDVKEYVLQLGLFDEVDDATAELAVFLASNARSAKKMTDYFNAIANYIEKDSAKRLTLDIFDDPKPISMADVIDYANKTTNTKVDTPMTQDMFAEPATPVVEPVPTAAPAAAPASDELDAKVADFENTVNDADFNPADFNAEAFIALVSAAEGNAALTARIQAISATYQQKLIAASMAAMTALAGGA